METKAGSLKVTEGIIGEVQVCLIISVFLKQMYASL